MIRRHSSRCREWGQCKPCRSGPRLRRPNGGCRSASRWGTTSSTPRDNRKAPLDLVLGLEGQDGTQGRASHVTETGGAPGQTGTRFMIGSHIAQGTLFAPESHRVGTRRPRTFMRDAVNALPSRRRRYGRHSYARRSSRRPTAASPAGGPRKKGGAVRKMTIGAPCRSAFGASG